MNPQAIDQARARHAKATKALASLEAATNFREAEEAWTDFLLACSTIYTKLEQGAKDSGTSAAWFGRKKKERKDDPLLRYLHFARNCDEHGIEPVTRRDDGSADHNRALPFNKRTNLRICKVNKVTGKPDGNWMEAVVHGPMLKTCTAHDRRYNDHCDPPSFHLGKRIAFNFPKDIGQLALVYLGKMIEEAEQLAC